VYFWRKASQYGNSCYPRTAERWGKFRSIAITLIDRLMSEIVITATSLNHPLSTEIK
jgi:hypothetical protein